MKIEATGYMHEPYLLLRFIPETEVETALLRVLWKHGRMEETYSGFVITQKPVEAAETAGGEE